MGSARANVFPALFSVSKLLRETCYEMVPVLFSLHPSHVFFISSFIFPSSPNSTSYKTVPVLFSFRPFFMFPFHLSLFIPSDFSSISSQYNNFNRKNIEIEWTEGYIFSGFPAMTITIKWATNHIAWNSSIEN